jgi:acyl-CoA thioesterase FadM
MGAVGFENDRPGFTATMTVNYRIAVPLATVVTVRARIVKIEGSKTSSTAEMILPDGRIAADSQGLFIFSQTLLEQVKAYYRRADEA